MMRRPPHPLVVQIAELRRAAGVSRPEAADLAGIGVTSIRAWEAGKLWPTVDGLERYAGAFNARLVLASSADMTALLSRLEAELHALPPVPLGATPFTAEMAVQNRRALADAMGFRDDYEPGAALRSATVRGVAA